MQIGHLDGLTYCLSLKPAFLAGEANLVQFFQDALSVAEMEDQQIGGGRQPDGSLVAQVTLHPEP